MALIPYEPFRQLDHWTRDIDRFFNDFPRGLGISQDIVHRFDVYETENEVVASCEIPGLEKKEDVHIGIENNVLTISGSIQKGHQVEDDQLHRSERFSGRFQRSVTLPTQVMDEGAKASYRNGILEIHMPKAKAQGKKQIDVEFH